MASTDRDTDRNKSLVAQFHQRVWAEGDLSAVDDHFLPEAAIHFTGFEGSAVQTVKDDAARWWGAFEGTETAIQDMIAEGDRVVVRWDTTGTHVSDYGKVAPTGKRIHMSGIDIFRFEDGLIVECWSMWDGLDVFDQLGVLPELW
ncbi:ester cyclase [Microbacterium sp. LRZ72]|uniref:ester cyclase n=1 Tax=Microbacterium sp. LRZ72 TaxID=2942481 RepID=UPI0029B7A993|nr:ester cyclase [Microbacterium sp. LRZ72]MDX2377654.1 ester cyclase [Microbacterium sp. LRZ72]